MSIKFKKEILTLSELAALLGLPNQGRAVITSITTDSRETESGSLFVALKGDRFDGHDFIPQAIARGASAVIAERMPEGISEDDIMRVLVVPSSLEALGKIAKAYKSRIKPRTIAVTGSVGKTTTKEFIYAVVSARYLAHKTEGNFNSELGMPLSVLSMPETAQVCVLEM